MNQTIRELENQIKEQYRKHYADLASSHAVDLVINAYNASKITRGDLDYLLQYNEARYDQELAWLEYIETLHD